MNTRPIQRVLSQSEEELLIIKLFPKINLVQLSIIFFIKRGSTYLNKNQNMLCFVKLRYNLMICDFKQTILCSSRVKKRQTPSICFKINAIFRRLYRTDRHKFEP